MVSGRPLLYLSLPGVAFILGVFWFRRRNKNRLDKPDDEDNSTKESSGGVVSHVEARTANGGLQNGKLPTSFLQQQATKSMNINGTDATENGNGSGSGSDEKDSPNTMLYGKSAPIKIQSNGRTPPGVQQQIDSEMLKSKIQDAEHKKLCSIDEDFENLSSPRDLPDSVSTRVLFHNRKTNSKVVEPVVIKATRTPKISPENSFLEATYTKECEQNNNCQPGVSKKVAVVEEKPKPKPKPNPSPNPKEAAVVGHHDCDIQTDIKETDNNGNQKRNVDAASPSLSICSVQSGDSGKGSSLPRSEATRVKVSYEFVFPVSLIGQLYGRKRAFINQIKAKTQANVLLSKNPCTNKLRICVVEGTESEIDAALAMIRQRLPVKRYPNFTMQRIHFALPQTIVPLSPQSLSNLQLKLFEGINNDVVVSAVLSGSHLFVNHPLHPSHPALPMLQKQLFDSYSEMEAPLLPGIEISAVCVLPVNGIWYRVQIVDLDEDDEERCVVKFLDFGGYMNVNLSVLRQIRTDFMVVPFQATECILSNIEPINGTWSLEANDVLSKLTKGIVLQAQVAGYNSHNIPEIFLFASLGPNNVIFLNKELVARNLAKWVEMRD
ncbi:A-kinase anchor protein 1, mitochondrial [Drosophila pseudoobscura]|uniref:A-kinase anchor protein 1, mitochondrial n=2 Tax=Drosophila pseudoobscura TaxID=7237 RepID=A0A6I8WCH0_DROPS|nr:A-kinase anchor protein 1, mitochondrial [Drosophila pseudoobscura]XP_033241107.1 A-kinase anchor protein 1, mitochondrial [Drosophila pseudoobscura]